MSQRFCDTGVPAAAWTHARVAVLPVGMSVRLISRRVVKIN